LWILRSGARWCDLPWSFLAFDLLAATARLEEPRVWLEIWRTFLSELNERQQLKWSESFMDAVLLQRKRGDGVGKTKRGKGRSGWWWSTARVFLWETTFTLHPRGGQLVEKTLAAIRVRRRHRAGRPRQKPERMIMDRGYDSDGLRRQLRRLGIEPIVPHRKGRRKPSMQTSTLRRYKRRWIVERTFAWLGNFRRLTALRPFADGLSRFLSYRLLHDHLRRF